jgi:Tfp pilus assembly protein FimT
MEKGRKEQERIEAGLEPNEAESDFLEFFNAVEKAKAEAVSRNVAIIQKSAHSGTWQAAAWWLERTQQQIFGRKQQLEHTGAEGQPIKLEVSTQEIEEKVKTILNKRKGE